MRMSPKIKDVQKKPVERPWLRTALALFGVVAALSAGSFLIIGYLLPDKVAHTLVERGRTPLALDGTPLDRGMKYENVSFKSSDGLTLKGWWIPVPKGKPQGTVVLAHGLYHNRLQTLSRAAFLHEAGYQVLLMDFRGHGESEKAALTGGLAESQDLVGAADYLKASKKLQPPLVYLGLSLGAMAAMRAGVTVEEAVLILDSPLPNVRAYVSRRTVGKWFVNVPGFTESCLKAYNRDTGLHLTTADLDLTPTAQQLKERWVLIFVGEKDDLAPVKEVERLFKDIPTRTKQLFITPMAGHEGTYQSAPALYERTVLAFLNSYKKSVVLKAGKQKSTR